MSSGGDGRASQPADIGQTAANASVSAEQLPRTPETARLLRFETFRDLYFAERSRRESIRASIGIPAAGLSFALFAFLTLSSHLEIRLLQEAHPPSIAMTALALAAMFVLFVSVWHGFRAEWRFVYSEPPDLEEFLRLEREIHRRGAADDQAALQREVEAQTRDLLTASYYVAYQRYVAGNTHSARQRAWALRLVFVGVLLLFLSAALLPFHLAASG